VPEIMKMQARSTDRSNRLFPSGEQVPVSTRADWSRAIAWHLSTRSLVGSRRDSCDGLSYVPRHAVKAWNYTTTGDMTSGRPRRQTFGSKNGRPGGADGSVITDPSSPALL